ncbi:MAG: primosomal protein N' [Pseudomonadota bacterium]
MTGEKIKEKKVKNKMQYSYAYVTVLDSTLAYLLYRIPKQYQESIQIGSNVIVPLQYRLAYGFIVGFESETNLKLVKDIEFVLTEEIISADYFKWLRWIADYYKTDLQYVIKTACFSEIMPEINKVFKLNETSYDICFDKLNKNALFRIHARLKKNKELPEKKLKQGIITKEYQKAIRYLLKEKLVSIFYNISKAKRVIQETQAPYKVNAQDIPILNNDQDISVKEILKNIKENEFKVFLLHGVTGSGKTEVYLRSIEYAISKDMGAIFLLPEISLTPQMQRILKTRFGDKIAVFHSALSKKLRTVELNRIKTGEVKVAVGARSAIFLQIKNLGIIAIDEEHETSYKQDTEFTYNARDIAIVRAKFTNSTVILGSATPIIESYFNAKHEKYHLLNLPKRVKDLAMPEVKIIDMKEEGKEFGERKILAEELKEAIYDNLQKGLQTILFINRRGYASVVLCSLCGEITKCPNCSISLTYHESANKLICHYCTYEKIHDQYCYECSKNSLIELGLGTQKVEEEVRLAFPKARIKRMDSDTVTSRNHYEEFYKNMLADEIDIVIGTQMITKGLDFPKVSLIGIVAADISLGIPDFRAPERTFQLITQVAGRSGRDKFPGKVFIQTYNPEHYSITCASKQDYHSFYQQEEALRSQIHFPPFVRLVLLKLSSKAENDVEYMSGKIAEILREKTINEDFMQVFGPSQSPIFKINNKFRYQILLKIYDRKKFDDFINANLEKIQNIANKNSIDLRLDVDPYSFY